MKQEAKHEVKRSQQRSRMQSRMQIVQKARSKAGRKIQFLIYQNKLQIRYAIHTIQWKYQSPIKQFFFFFIMSLKIKLGIYF